MNVRLKLGWVALAFVFSVAVGGTGAQAAGTAALSGKVTLSGSAPAPQKIQMAADPACMQQRKDAVFARDLVVNNGGIQYALVYVKAGVQGAYPAPTQPVVLNQQGCMYEPHVFGVQAGQPVQIINEDSTLHNINCQAKTNKKFNIAQPAKGMKSTKTFDQPEVGIPFKCNVHPWMAAWADVFNHPFFTVTDATGAYSIKGLPAGTYTVEVWQEKLGTQSQQATVADGETKDLSFSLKGK